MRCPGLQSEYGFKPGLSTVGAIRVVMGVVARTAKGAVLDRCLLVTLDNCSAFNTAPWSTIDALAREKGLLL